MKHRGEVVERRTRLMRRDFEFSYGKSQRLDRVRGLADDVCEDAGAGAVEPQQLPNA